MDKLKLKDLAVELKSNPNDLLKIARDMDIKTKGPNSSLSEEEAERIRSRVRDKGGSAVVVQTEVHGRVKIRRKIKESSSAEEEAERPETSPQAPDQTQDSAPAKTPSVEHAPEQVTPEPSPEEKVQPRPMKARILESAVRKAPKEAEAPPHKEEAGVLSERIEPSESAAVPENVEMAGKTEHEASAVAKPEGSVSVESAEKETAAAAAEAPAERPVRERVRADKSQISADAGADGRLDASQSQDQKDKAKRNRKRNRKKRELLTGPQVKIISMPEPPAPKPAAPPETPPARIIEEAPARTERTPQRTVRFDRTDRPRERSDQRPYTPGDRQDRPGGGDRPGGDRPGGDRPGGDRPGGSDRPGGRPPFERKPRTGDRPAGGFPDKGGDKPGDRRSRPVSDKPRAAKTPAPAIISQEKSAAERRRKNTKREVDVASLEKAKKPAFDKNRKSADIVDRTGKIRKGRKSKDKKTIIEKSQIVTQPLKAAKRKIRVEEAIRVSDMAHQMGVKSQELIRVLMNLGFMATINQILDMETATLVASEFDYEIDSVGFSEDTYLPSQEPDKPENLVFRPPVVTIMGHVDHGKTSLLDAIRKTNVTLGEAGGITQHIGAYHVSVPRGEVVFLDTPGHEAFTAMRARGAQVTDLVVLVVAADDGVMEQTREAINHSKAAGVPIVVAVNKIDKEGANPDRVKRELSELGLVSEDWGGETIFAHVSAKKRIGLEELLEMILLQAEVLELKANPAKEATGRIIEARMDKGRGPVATVLIQNGTLKQGDVFLCGTSYGKVRALFNDQGKKIRSAGPAMPVEVQGFDALPEAGEEFIVMKDEKIAKRIAETRQTKQREIDMAKAGKVTLESFLKAKAAGEQKFLNLVLKADVQGSLQAVTDALNKLSTDEVKIKVIHGAAGGITESDIMLAAASQAIVIGFNVRPTAKVKEMAEKEKIEIRFYDIIYNLVSEVKDAMSGMLSPIFKEVYLGQAEVRQTFSVPKIGMVAGCGVIDGKLTRNAKVRLLREGVVIYTGKLSSLKRFKDDAKEVVKGYECGVGLENYNDIKVSDIIEAFEEVQEQPTL